MAKVTKSIRLPVDVAERLENEPNQSVAVEESLRIGYRLLDADISDHSDIDEGVFNHIIQTPGEWEEITTPEDADSWEILTTPDNE